MVSTMANSDEQVTKFMQAITAYAEEQSRAIHQEVEDFKAERLREAEREVLRDSYLLIQKEQDDMRRKLSREMSLRDMDARRELLSTRRDMAKTIFARAEEKLAAFTKTPAYRDWLLKSLAAIAEKLPADGTVYELRREDEDLCGELRAACPAETDFRFVPDIRLGGLRGVNAAAGIVADDTLDTRLAQQHDWFTEHSGLTIE